MTERKTPWTTGPWKAWTSNSHWRIGSGNADGNILCAVRGSDGLPVIHVKPEDARLLVAAPTIAEKAEAVAEAASVALGAILTLYDPAIGLAAGAKPDSDTINMANEISEQLTLALSDLKAALAAAKGGA